MPALHSGIGMIADERQEQITKHNYSIEEDDAELCRIAALAILTADLDVWPYADKERFMHIMRKPDVEHLVIAGAFIAAAIDASTLY